MKKMLLHICCASCGLFVFETLSGKYEITGFFYNPNIHPAREYESRKQELNRIFNKYSYPVIFAEYDMENWFIEFKHLKGEPERGERCEGCFYFRLKNTFLYALENKYDIVASTLSISPYKVAEQINNQGKSLSSEFKIEFLAANFKKQDGFNKAKKKAISEKIKHQNYCGCAYSLADRMIRSGKGKKQV